MNKYLAFLLSINFKTLYFNFKYLPFKQAIKLPFLISKWVILHKMKGEVVLTGPIHTSMIRIGFGNVGFFDKKRSRTMWDVRGKVIFHGKAAISQGTKISVGHVGTLELGNNFGTNAEVTIIVRHYVKFGEGSGASWNTTIIDTDFHNICDKDGNIINPPKPIIIGDRVWIGFNVTILKGAVIPDDSMIGANSMVSKDITGKSGIFVGSPAKLYKEGISWKL